MQSVLILSPSFLPVRAMAAPVTDPEGDPGGGFSLALAGGEAVGDDDEAAVDPAGGESQMAAGPLLSWAGAVAKGGGADGAMPSEAAARSGTAGPPGVGANVPASARGAAAALAWEMASPAPPVSGAQGPGGGGWVMRRGEEGQHPAAGSGPDATDVAGQVAAVIGGAGQAAGAREACADAPETDRGKALAEPLSQVAAPAVTAQIPQPRSGQGPVAVPGQLDLGGTGTGAAGLWMGDTDGISDGPIAGLTGTGGGLAPRAPNAPANLPAQTDVNRVPVPGSALPPTGAMTGDGTPARVELRAGDDVAGEPIPVPEDAARWPGRVPAHVRPQAGFWERLLSGVADASVSAKAADGLAGPVPSARPEDRAVAPLVAPVAIPPAILPEGAGLAKPGVVGPAAQTWPVGATAGRFAPAEPTESEAMPPTPDVAPRTAAPETGPRAASGAGTTTAFPLAEAVPEVDPNREASGDPALVAPGAAPLSPSGPQASLAAAAAPMPIPQLAAQLVAALTRQTGGETELALSPEELGHVRVKLKPDAAHPDRLVVMITFERPETLDLFRRHAGELTDALRSAGYSGADIGFGQQGSGQPDPDPRAGTASQSFDGIPRPDPDGAAHPLPRHSGAASLDLRL